MKQYIGCDAHARYSVFVSVDETGRIGAPVRVDLLGRGLRDYLQALEKDTPVAVEASGGSAGATRPTNWMRAGWPSCCEMGLFQRYGFRRASYGICGD